MIIQLRKTYKTRAGDKVKIVSKYDKQTFLGSNKVCYSIDGKFCDRQDCDVDLVEEL